MNTKFPANPVITRRGTLHRNLPAQRGAALIFALIILIVLTLLGLSSVQTATLEERMSANTFDRALAFQAAEAGLRTVEEEIDHGTCSGSGLDVAQLLTDAGNEASAAPPENLTLDCEDLGIFRCSEENLCKRYRITATSSGTDRANVELQTLYVTSAGSI